MGIKKERLYEHEYFRPSTEVLTAGAGAVVSFSNPARYSEEQKVQKATAGERAVEFVSWGQRNDLPSAREQLICGNNILPSLLSAKRDFLLGAGLLLARDRFDGDSTYTTEYRALPPQVEDFLDQMEASDLFTIGEAAGELILQNNLFVEYVHRAGGPITAMRLHKSHYARAERMQRDDNAGRTRVQNWLLCSNWQQHRKRQVKRVPAYDPTKKFQSKYIVRYADKMFGGPYYYSPDFWGGRTWIQLANKIPEFHLHNLHNGYTPRFHVKIPKGFFLKLKPNQSLEMMSEKAAQEILDNAVAARGSFLKKLNDLLEGTENAGRTIWSTYDVAHGLGKEYSGIVIDKIDFDMRDKALLELFEKSNDANISAQGVPPSLSSVQQAGKLSSGNDVRNSMNFYLAVRVREKRRILFNTINHVGLANGWFTGKNKGFRIRARDIVLTTTDKNPTGMTGDNDL